MYVVNHTNKIVQIWSWRYSFSLCCFPQVDSGLPQTPADKLAQAGILKERGNQLFKLEQWKDATKSYHHALMYIRSVLSGVPDDFLLKTLFLKTENPLQQPSPSENESAKQMLLTLSNNLAGYELIYII